MSKLIHPFGHPSKGFQSLAISSKDDKAPRPFKRYFKGGLTLVTPGLRPEEGGLLSTPRVQS